MVQPCTKANNKMILAILWKWVRTHGSPKEFICDEERIFQTKISQDYVQNNDIDVMDLFSCVREVLWGETKEKTSSYWHRNLWRTTTSDPKNIGSKIKEFRFMSINMTSNQNQIDNIYDLEIKPLRVSFPRLSKFHSYLYHNIVDPFNVDSIEF